MKMAENDYDDLRKRNIAERAIFAEISNDLEEKTNEIKELEKKYNDAKDTKKSKSTKRHRIRSIEKFTIERSELDFCKRYNRYRRRSKSVPEDKEEEKENNLTKSGSSKRKLFVLFPWAKQFQRSIDLMKTEVCDADEEQHDDDNLSKTIIKRIYNKNRVTSNLNNIPSVDEITDEMLDNVATKFSLKQHCKVNGSCCHQCRQKTLDTKTVCRSGKCSGIRGKFCGPCLKGRYGEDIVAALKNPDWTCPPCRGLCNCSVCRKKSGLRPTGMLVPIVKRKGHSSVMDYLQVAKTDDAQFLVLQNLQDDQIIES